MRPPPVSPGRRPPGARASRFAACLLVVLAALAPALAAAPAAALPAPPNCTIVLDQPTQTSRPTSTSSATLTFSGSVNATVGSSGSRNMAIVADITPTTWAASVVPASENITGTEQVDFNATVAVPAMELASTRGTLTIRASFQAIPGVQSSTVNCSSTAAVLVAQYFGVNADTTNARITVAAGPTGVLASVIVHNLGNGLDTFSVSLEDPLTMQEAGIHTNLPLPVTLGPDAETNVSFSVNASSDAKEEATEMIVVVKSNAQPAAVADTVRITVVVESGAIITKLPDLTTLAVLLAVLGGLVGFVMLRRRTTAKRAGRLARQNLRRLRDQRYAGEPPSAAAEQPAAVEPPAPPGKPPKVRVRVKAPPPP